MRLFKRKYETMSDAEYEQTRRREMAERFESKRMYRFLADAGITDMATLRTWYAAVTVEPEPVIPATKPRQVRRKTRPPAWRR